MTMVNALALLAGIYFLSTTVAKLSGGRLPSALLTTPIMLILFWSGIMTAEDINTSGITTIYQMTMTLLLVNMGTTLDIQMLWKKKRLIPVCLAALAGIAVFVFTIGQMLFGRDLAYASYPTLAGSQVATYMMQEVALEKGMDEIAAIILLMLVCQQWISMPLIANLTRMEALKFLKKFRDGSMKLISPLPEANTGKDEGAARSLLIDRIPRKYATVHMHFFLCALFSAFSAWLGNFTAGFAGGILNASLMGLVIGVAAREAGLIEKDPLGKANVLPFFMFALIMGMRASLASLSPSGLLAALAPIFGLLFLGVAGIILMSLIVGKIAGLSPAMSILVGIQAYSGYPVNYQIGTEVIEAVASTKEEIETLKELIIPNLVIGGVISVSISSVVIASVLVNLW